MSDLLFLYFWLFSLNLEILTFFGSCISKCPKLLTCKHFNRMSTSAIKISPKTPWKPSTDREWGIPLTWKHFRLTFPSVFCCDSAWYISEKLTCSHPQPPIPIVHTADQQHNRFAISGRQAHSSVLHLCFFLFRFPLCLWQTWSAKNELPCLIAQLHRAFLVIVKKGQWNLQIRVRVIGMIIPLKNIFTYGIFIIIRFRLLCAWNKKSAWYHCKCPCAGRKLRQHAVVLLITQVTIYKYNHWIYTVLPMLTLHLIKSGNQKQP